MSIFKAPFCYSVLAKALFLPRQELRNDLYKHIAQNCSEKGIFLKAINGYHHHIHCLISLGKEPSVAKVSQLIKGESSFWINKNHLIEGGFSWQDDYFAVSIGESQVDAVIKYIMIYNESRGSPL